MRYLRRVGLSLAAIGLGALAWAAFTPIRAPSRDVLFEIPKEPGLGAWRGNKVKYSPPGSI